MKEEKCPCCPNHCSINNLSCGKGKSYFSNDKNENKHHFEKEIPNTVEEKLLQEMKKCGHHLHHNRESNLDFLTNEEKETLTNLLSKCYNNWNK